jgi:putative membrane protein
MASASVTTAVIPAALLAALHYLTLALGFGSVLLRGVRLRDLRRTPAADVLLPSLFRADALWGVAAGLWLASGLARAFGGLERARTFYTHNGFFMLKMALFAAIFALEIRPMVTFIRWRSARRRGAFQLPTAQLGPLIRLNDLEIAVLVVIPVVASLMARGAWLF